MDRAKKKKVSPLSKFKLRLKRKLIEPAGIRRPVTNLDLDQVSRNSDSMVLASPSQRKPGNVKVGSKNYKTLEMEFEPKTEEKTLIKIEMLQERRALRSSQDLIKKVLANNVILVDFY